MRNRERSEEARERADVGGGFVEDCTRTYTCPCGRVQSLTTSPCSQIHFLRSPYHDLGSLEREHVS